MSEVDEDGVGGHHRDVQGGAARAAVFGISDRLITNVSLILGMAGASVDPSVVRLAGFAGLLAGAFSMAAGEFVSMSPRSELLQREPGVERRALEEDPQGARRELARIYAGRGIDHRYATAMAGQVMKDPQLALEVHAREETGIDPKQLGSPPAAAGSSFVSFAVGAIIPLLPWFLTGGTVAVALSIGLAVAAAIGIGAIVGSMTDRPLWFTASRQVLVGAIAGPVTYGVEAALGVSVA